MAALPARGGERELMPLLTTDEWVAPAVPQPARAGPVLVRFPAMMWGILFVGLGVACYIGGVLLAAARHLLAPWLPADEIVRMVLWYSGMPVVAGFLLIVFEVVALVPRKRRVTEVVFDPIENRTMTVVLTVYNDGESIGASVRDFRGTPWFAG